MFGGTQRTPAALAIQPKEGVIAVGLGCLLLFGALFCGGNRPLPLMLLQLGALAVLVLRLWPPVFAGETKPGVLIIAALVFCYPLLYLMPLPLELWTQLPGRARYAEALALVEAPSGSWRPVTIVPARTESAWLTLLPPLATFIAAVGLPRRWLKVLIGLAVGVAVGQALLGLMQYGAGRTSLLCLGNPYCGDTATGTYANRNHLAGLLEMMLPVSLGLLAATVGQAPLLKQNLVSWRKHLLALSSSRAQLATLYGAASLAILLGLVFTRSRSGVTLAMIGMLFALFSFAGRLGGNNSLGVFGTLNAIALVLAVEIGLAPVLQRFTLEDPLEDSRWAVFTST